MMLEMVGKVFIEENDYIAASVDLRWYSVNNEIECCLMHHKY